jgi:hypothetical protein
MGPLTYKVFTLHFFKQRETSHLTLAATKSVPHMLKIRNDHFLLSRNKTFEPVHFHLSPHDPLKLSTINKNRKCDKGSPYLSPLWILIPFVGLPFTRTRIFYTSTHPLSIYRYTRTFLVDNQTNPNHWSRRLFQNQPLAPNILVLIS